VAKVQPLPTQHAKSPSIDLHLRHTEKQRYPYLYLNSPLQPRGENDSTSSQGLSSLLAQVPLTHTDSGKKVLLEGKYGNIFQPNPGFSNSQIAAESSETLMNAS